MMLGSSSGEIERLVTESKDQPTIGGSDSGRPPEVVLGSGSPFSQKMAGFYPAVCLVPRKRVVWVMEARTGRLLEKS